MLQGFHLAPFACLCCLHDANLEPTHGLGDPPPVDGMPVDRIAGGCTSPVLYCYSGQCRHLPCLLSRLIRCSRDERPDGSLPACAWGDVPSRGQPLSERLPLGIRFLRPPLPAALSAFLAVSFP